MGSTAHPPSEHEPLLADPETRASPLHTGRGVARFLAAIVTTAVLTILALHFTFGPDFGTTVATQVDYEESLPQARTRKAESVLSEITRIANEHAVLVAAAAYIAGGNNANAAGPSATTIQIPPMHQNQSNKQEPPNLGKEKHRRDGGTNHHTDSTDANPSQLRSSGEISSQPDVVRARLRITTSDWHTPMYIISMPNDEREKSRVAISLIKVRPLGLSPNQKPPCFADYYDCLLRSHYEVHSHSPTQD